MTDMDQKAPIQRWQTAGPDQIRIDLQLVADLVKEGSRVLDVGCGDGALLDHLTQYKGVDGRGIEINPARVNACVSQGLSVIQGNAETVLKDYPSEAFDYVILGLTLQSIHDPRQIITEFLRIGKRAIVSITNFGYWRVRCHLLFQGRMPVSDAGEHDWCNTDNIRLCTIRDFVILCDELGITIERCFTVGHGGRTREVRPTSLFANLMGKQAVFVLA